MNKLTDLTYEQRKPLIETAFFIFSGKWPSKLEVVDDGSISRFYFNPVGDLYLVDFNHRPNIYRGRVCTKGEFERLSEELGDKYGYNL